MGAAFTDILTETILLSYTHLIFVCNPNHFSTNISITYTNEKRQIISCRSNTYTVMTPDVSLTPLRSVLGLSPGLVSFYVTRR